MQQDEVREEVSEKPDLDNIHHELKEAVSDADYYIKQNKRDYETRMALWDGQDIDSGKKLREKLNREPKPWEGASDTRVFEIDGIINEQLTSIKRAWRGSRVQTRALRADAMARSQTVDYLLRWLLKIHMRARVENEIELAFQWRQTYGNAAMGVYWDQQLDLTKQVVTLDDLQQNAAQGIQNGDQTGAILLNLVQDPLLEDQAAEILMARSQQESVISVLKFAKARKIIRNIREKGAAEIPIAGIKSSLPCWESLRVCREFFFPISTVDIQRARWVAKRDYMTETEVLEKVQTEGWDESWAEDAIKMKGRQNSLIGTEAIDDTFRNMNGGLWSSVLDPDDDRIEVYHYYQRAIDKSTGVPAMYCTVFAPGVVDKHARHDILKYKHGKYPFAYFRRERFSRLLIETRSLPEVMRDGQGQIKSQYDQRVDRGQMETLPMLEMPYKRLADQIPVGPGAKLGVRTRGEIGFIASPNTQPNISVDIEDRAQKRLDRYVGRTSEYVPPPISSAMQASQVEDFMSELLEAVVQTFQLSQQYITPIETERIVSGNRVPFSVSKEEIQGEYDFEMIIASGDADIEVLVQKIPIFKEAIAADKNGVLDMSSLVREMVSMIDPSMAERIVGDQAAAAQAEIEDERNNLAKIISGIEPSMKDGGQNYQLRLQVLQSEMEKNPAILQRIQSNEDSSAILENRVKHLTFMVQQQENAQTGRVGTEPVKLGNAA